MKRRRWLVILAVSTVFAAAGVFFANQDLGSADQYASVASFFLALLGVAASLVSRARLASLPSAPTESRAAIQERPSKFFSLLLGNKNVQVGPGAVMNVDNSRIVQKQKRRTR